MSTDNNTVNTTTTTIPDRPQPEGQYRKYIDIRQGWFCCTKLRILSQYHDGMEIGKETGRISVYAPKDSFWGRQINLPYFEFDFCPYCKCKLYTTTPGVPT